MLQPQQFTVNSGRMLSSTQSLRGSSLQLLAPCPRVPSSPRKCPVLLPSNCNRSSTGTICYSSPVHTLVGETPTSGRHFSLSSKVDKPLQGGGEKPVLACISRSNRSITTTASGEDCSSRSQQSLLSPLGTLLFLLAPPALSLLLPGVASASGGALSGGALDLFRQFLGGVEGLGPWGPVAFVAVVMLCEMVPLFPTQPLSLASGLLFGAINGALIMLLGVTLAAVNAFTIARGVGRPLAQKVIEWEMKGHDGKEGEEGGGESGIASKMSEVQQTIERGGLWQQITAITLLRLTPVVPFSASNYLLGLTPVQMPAFLGGTIGGMTVWSVLYASLGGASRKLLDNGADVGSLLADLGGKASTMSANIAGYSLVIIGGVAVVYFVKIMVQKNSATSPSSTMPLAGSESITSSNSDSWQKQQQPQQPSSLPQGQSTEAGAKAEAPTAAAGARGSAQAQQQQQLRGASQANQDALQNK